MASNLSGSADPSPERARAAREARRRGRRWGWLLRRDKIFPRIKINHELKFYHQVLGLDHLSFGLWDGDPLSLEGLKTAQRRYAEYLCSWIPPGARTVLDVGCGTGETSLLLRQRGLAPEGLAPDPYEAEVFVERTGLPFHLVRFELYRPDNPFDLVLMRESAQYVMLDQLFRNAVRVAPGGLLLVSDYFRVAEAEGPLAKSGHPLDEFLDEARRWGCVIRRQEDVTERVLPTLDLANRWLERYVEPAAAIAAEAVRGRVPVLYGILRWALWRRLDRLRHSRLLVASGEFASVKRYLFFLFELPPAASARRDGT